MARKLKGARNDGRLEKKVTVVIDGKEVRKSVYGYNQLDLATNIKKLQDECKAAQNPLFITVADEWKENHFKTVTYGTRTCYNPAYKKAVAEFGDMRISEIEPIDIKQLLDKLKRQGYSAKVVKTQKTVLNQIFNYGIVEMKLYKAYSNPVSAVSLPKNLPRTKRTLPSDEDIKKIIDNVNEPFGLYAFFLLFTGCRRGEALALKWQDIDFKNRSISINKIIAYENNKAILYDRVKTSAGVREIFLLDTLYIVLKEYKKKIKPKCSDYIFAENGTTPYTPSRFRTNWKKYCKSIDIEITPHQLRHAYATILYDANVDEKTAQYLLGHSDIELTRNIYTHIRQAKKDKEKDSLNKYINKNLCG